jgi:subtilisin family serine protease
MSCVYRVPRRQAGWAPLVCFAPRALLASLLVGAPFATVASATPVTPFASVAPAAWAEAGLPARIVLRIKPGHEHAPVDPQGRRERPDRPMPAQAVAALSAAAGWPLAYVRPLPDGAHVLEAAMAAGSPSARQLAASLRRLSSVDRAEEDAPVTTQSLPDAQELSRLWNLRSAAGGAYGSGFVDAWSHARGRASVVVAIIDTGVLPHPDLVGAGGSLAQSSGAIASPGYDFTSDCRIRASCPAGTPTRSAAVAPSPGALDLGDWISASDQAYAIFANCQRAASSWHGTHVAGVVGALADAQGVVGAAWGVRLLPVRVLGKCGGYMSDVAESILWAAGVHPTIPNPTPARVLNLSVGGGGGCSATMQSAIDAARAAGALVVAAAGNSSVDAATASVAGCDGVVSVAATTKSGDLASYSNRSTTHVSLSAPGGDARSWGGQVLSAMNTGATVHDASGWTHAERSGTSFAAPHVAAAAALMLSRDPAVSPTALRAALAAPGAVTPFPDGSSCRSSGACGAGILDAARLLSQASARPRPSTEAIAFGNVAIGSESLRSLRITNDNRFGLPIGAAVLSASVGFGIAADDCSERELGALASCTVTVSFSAGAQPRLAAATLSLQAPGPGAPLLALPLAAAVGSLLSASPAHLRLGTMSPGETSSVRVTFGNATDSPQRLRPLRIVGTAHVGTVQDGCGNVELAPRQSCEVALALGPSLGGDYSAQVIANTDGDGDVPFIVTIDGSAPVAAALVVSSPLLPAGSGGCTVLGPRGGAPDATLALAALGLLGWRRWRRWRASPRPR